MFNAIYISISVYHGTFDAKAQLIAIKDNAMPFLGISSLHE